MSEQLREIPGLELTADNPTSGRTTIRFGEFGRWLLDNHLDTIRRRREYEHEFQQHPVLKTAEAVLVTGLEAVPFVGDGVTLWEAIRGKTFDGYPLSIIERAGYVFFSIPPPFMPIDLPARPIIAAYHELDKHILTPLFLDILEDQPGEPIIGQNPQAITASRRLPFPSQINRVSPQNSNLQWA